MPHRLTARQAAAALRRGEITAVELAEHLLARTERYDAAVGAYVTRTDERWLAEAAAADRRLQAAGQDDPLPPLLGVPVPVKDLTEVAGVPCRYGSAAFPADGPASLGTEDAGVVRLLRAAGATLPGKTNAPELGLPCYTEPDIAPPARTPWDATRSAGGSSGGAAAAVAAGLVPVAHASDGGGSIRIPASACGLVGLKPSRGRISFGPLGVDVSGLTTHGSVTRDVRDTALLLDVLAQPWPGDQHLLPGPATSYLDACERPPGPLRVGVLTEPVIAADAAVDPACLDAVAAVAQVLEQLGHQVEPVPPPFRAEKWAAFEVVWGVLAGLAPVPVEREPLLRPLTRWLRERGAGASGAAYATALAEMQAATRVAASAWQGVDVVLSPTLASPPAPVGSLRNDADPAADFDAQMRFTPWTSVWNVTGWPAISLPTHRIVRDGTTLPIGVMLGAGLGQEERLLGLAAALEEALPWADTLPRTPVRHTSPT